MTPLLPLTAAAAVAASGGSLALLRASRRRQMLAARLLAVRRGDAAVAAPSAPGYGVVVRLVAGCGLALARSGLLSSGTIIQLEQTLLSAGLRGPNGLGLFVGVKLLLTAAAPMLAWLLLQHFGYQGTVRNGGTAAAAAFGLLLPDYVVRSRRASFLNAVQLGLADALDMMVICSEAGLGLEPAITRVAAEIVHAHPAVAAEFSQTASELRVMADRRAALVNMGGRTGLESLKRLGATLIQTMQYGTPLSQALRTLSAEMRGEMLTRFEARAAKLPVLLTLPMIVFILPVVFMIVGGPAMLSVLASLRH